MSVLLRAVPWRNRPWPRRGTPQVAWARPRNRARKILCEIPQAYTLVRLLEQGHLVGYDLRCGKGADGNAEKCARFSTRLVAVFVVTCVEHCVG